MRVQSDYHSAVAKKKDSANGLAYFTHEVNGRLYGGWYRKARNLQVEVIARGKRRTAELGRLKPEDRARVLLEEIVLSLTPSANDR